MEVYQAYSGQKVNAHKSSFYLSSRAIATEANLVSLSLNFHRQGCPFIYLGAPILTGRPTCGLFYGILDKMRKRLSYWTTKLLSHGGKVVLIRHVLLSIPMYLMQVLRPPQAVLRSLERLCNVFLWDHSMELRRIHWAS